MYFLESRLLRIQELLRKPVGIYRIVFQLSNETEREKMLLEILFHLRPALLSALAAAVVLVVMVQKISRNRQIYKLGKRSALIKSHFFG